ncbi:electroneutral sodium bicarbonate exchanger 1-like isoform X3 [Bolinopsis microptera]|uniref:electroneutral sodium bicarbonate exchanger 1-like isoform X3 n=1 Tax=Bolinopsis microptera TaxID=2820187 RepID=UPI00307938A4
MVQINNSQSCFSNRPISTISDDLSIDDNIKSGKYKSAEVAFDCEVPFLSQQRTDSQTECIVDSECSTDSVGLRFLKPPPKQRRLKKKRKKSIEKCSKLNFRKSSVKTIDSIPASIPEENSEDVISSDPDIETVEYVKNRELEVEEKNQNTVHSVHQIFSELDELVFERGENVWEEKARWMKFEQDIQRGADKWSKPHVATLKLQSIISLRKCISQGTVLLGMKAFNLESVIEMTLDRLVSRALITSSVAVQLRTLLLKRHVHTGEHQQEGVLKFRYHKGKFKNGILARISEGLSPEVSPSASGINSRTNSEQDLVKMKQHFLRKLPPDTEASNVMIGKLEYLEANICVTIRLSHSILLGDLTEVPIPTRFIFLLLCPDHSQIDHVEVGRAASTLFSDEMFYEAAYSASSKAEVIQGIDRFLEKAIVIPPSEWNPKMKITVPEEEEDVEEEEEDLNSGPDVAFYAHVKPFGGVLHDLNALKSRYRKDWIRVIRLLPLLATLQFSVQLLCHTLLLIQLASPQIRYPVSLTLIGVGVMGMVTSLASCVPLVVCSVSLPVILWEIAFSSVLSKFGVSYATVRPLLGVVSGVLLMVSSVLNAGNLLPAVSVFVYETVMTALPLSLVITILLMLLRYPLESNLLLCSIVLTLFTVVFLKIWQAITDSTMFTKKIRAVLKTLNLFTLIFITFFLVYFTSLETSPYPTRDTTALSKLTESFFDKPPAQVVNSNSTQLRNVQYGNNMTGNFSKNIPIQIGYPAFPAEVGVVTAGVVSGVLLTVLVVLMLGVVQSWINQPNHRVRKFSGRFWDQCLVGMGVLFSGVFGLPFLIPDLILTPILLHLLSKTSVTNQDMLYVKEQRATLTLSSLTMIIPCLLAFKLHLAVPLPLCWGVILFSSILGLRHTQLFERCKILLQSEKYHPEKGYVANTPQKVINSFTILQIVLTLVLVIVLVTPYTCVALPVVLVLLIVMRRQLLPLVMFDEQISLLEETTSPDPAPMESPSPSLSNIAEFSEEVSKLTDECSKHHAAVPRIIFDNLTDDDTLCTKANRPSCRELTFPAAAQNREHKDSEPGRVPSPPIRISLDEGSHTHSYDFLGIAGGSNNNFNCPLPFESDQEAPVRSMEPCNYGYTYEYDQQGSGSLGFIIPH